MLYTTVMLKAERWLTEYYETESVLNELDDSLVIKDIEKLNILGVFCGVKPFATVYNDSGREKIERISGEMGLKTDVIFWDDFGKRCEIRIAKNEEILKKARKIDEIFDSGESKKARLELGKLYGYPETSIQAFIKPHLRLEGERRQ